jgi:Flp pilus assembly protein TadG
MPEERKVPNRKASAWFSPEAGNVTLELALILPLLLLVLGGALDLGMLFWEKQVLTNATREGARAAIKASDDTSTVRPAKTQSQVRQIVQNYLTRHRIKDASGQPLVLNDSQFSYTWEYSAAGTLVTVALQQIPYRMMLLPNFRSFFGYTRQPGDQDFFLQARTIMAAEWHVSVPPPP